MNKSYVVTVLDTRLLLYDCIYRNPKFVCTNFISILKYFAKKKKQLKRKNKTKNWGCAQE